MNVKEMYNRIKKAVRCNPEYTVINKDCRELLDIYIDDEHKEIVLEFTQRKNRDGQDYICKTI